MAIVVTGWWSVVIVITLRLEKRPLDGLDGHRLGVLSLHSPGRTQRGENFVSLWVHCVTNNGYEIALINDVTFGVNVVFSDSLSFWRWGSHFRLFLWRTFFSSKNDVVVTKEGLRLRRCLWLISTKWFQSCLNSCHLVWSCVVVVVVVIFGICFYLYLDFIYRRRFCVLPAATTLFF